MSKPQWNTLKNERLKRTRGVSFEEVLTGTIVKIKNHPTRKSQSVMLIEYKKYIWVIPFVEVGGETFLKTLYPSRNYMKLHQRGKI